MKRWRIIFFMALYAATVASGQILPADRRIDWNPGPRADMPMKSASVNVLRYGARGDSSFDDSGAFMDAMAALPPDGGLLEVPAGRYLLRRGLHLGQGVTVRGEGYRKTRLYFDLDGRNENAVEITGFGTGDWIRLASGVPAGSRWVLPSSGTALTEGCLMEITQDNDPALLYTNSWWEEDWARDALGQVAEVEAVENDGRLRLAEPLLLAYEERLRPRVRRLDPIRWAGLERLALIRLDSGTGDMVLMQNAAFCRLAAIESGHTTGIHAFLKTAYRCEVRDGWFHHAHDYGEGGHGYGVDCAVHSAGNLVENNVFEHLRHAMIVQVGAGGNVFGYNYSRDEVADGIPLADLSLHGHYPNFNLFESNVVQSVGVADYWGPAGPGNTFLRNTVETGEVNVEDHSDGQNFIGNVLVSPASGSAVLRVNSTVSGTLMHGNRIGGVVQWDPSVPDRDIPDSYYLEHKPYFFGSSAWPSTDAQSDIVTGLPAVERYWAGRPVDESSWTASPDSGLGLCVFPNPNAGRFKTWIFLPASGPASLRLCDVLGRTVRILMDGPFEGGSRILELDPWPGERPSSGVYMLVLRSGIRMLGRKIVILAPSGS
jgi:hypothetical protein